MDISWLDIAMLAFLLLSMLIGVMRGFVFEALSLAGWFVAWAAARFCTPMAQGYVHIGEPGSSLNYGVTYACVFVATLIVWSIAARLVRALIRATPLSAIDRLLGAVFGAARALIVLSIAALLVGLSPWATAPMIQQSIGVAWLNAMVQSLRPVFVNDDSQHPQA
jgi:membrane protein required for colicin V production